MRDCLTVTLGTLICPNKKVSAWQSAGVEIARRKEGKEEKVEDAGEDTKLAENV